MPIKKTQQQMAEQEREANHLRNSVNEYRPKNARLPKAQIDPFLGESIEDFEHRYPHLSRALILKILKAPSLQLR